MKTQADPMSGLHLRGQTWWLRFPMVGGQRHPRMSLQTTDLSKALRRAEEAGAHPLTAPADALTGEMESHLAYMTGRKRYSAATERVKRVHLRGFIRFLPTGATLGSVSTEQVQAFYDAALARVSAAAAHKPLMDVRAFFRWAQVDRRLLRFPQRRWPQATPSPAVPRCPLKVTFGPNSFHRSANQ